MLRAMRAVLIVVVAAVTIVTVVVVADRASCLARVLAKSESLAAAVVPWLPKSSAVGALPSPVIWMRYSNTDPYFPASRTTLADYLVPWSGQVELDPLLDAVPRLDGSAIEVSCCIETMAFLTECGVIGVAFARLTRARPTPAAARAQGVMAESFVGRFAIGLLACIPPAAVASVLVRPAGWFWASIGYQSGFRVPIAYSWNAGLVKLAAGGTLLLLAILVFKKVFQPIWRLEGVRQPKVHNMCQSCGYLVSNAKRCAECGREEPGREDSAILTGIGACAYRRARGTLPLIVIAALLSFLWTTPHWLGLLGLH